MRQDPISWSQPFAMNLNNLALLYTTTRQFDKGIPLLETALKLCLSNFKQNPVEWHKHLRINVMDLINAYKETDQIDKLTELKPLIAKLNII